MERKNLGNRLGNTVCVAPRAIGTGLNTVSDATRTALYGVLNPIEGLGKTASNIREAIHKSCTEGPWYKRLWKAPASIITSPVMAVEGAIETLWYTGCNLFRNVRDTIANPFLNVGKSVKWMGSKEKIGDFEFSKINHNNEVSPKNRLANLFNRPPTP